MKIKLIDYGMGNIASVYNAFRHIGYAPDIVSSGAGLKGADMLVLPGVGAFGPAVKNLRKRGLYLAISEKVLSGTMFLGICLGFQLVFEESEEDNFTEKGFGFIKGRVVKFRFGNFKQRNLKVAATAKFPLNKGGQGVVGSRRLKPAYNRPIPHIGWNRVDYGRGNYMFRNLKKPFFYFDHSYYPVPEEKNIQCGYTEYGIRYCSAVLKDNIAAVQFHPEKSQLSGLTLLKNITTEFE